MDQMISFEKLEHRLLILCSRLHLAEANKIEIEEILENNDVDIDYLILLAKKHKVLQLITKHMIELDKKSKISSPNKRFLTYIYHANKIRNKVSFNEIVKVIKDFHKAGIKAIPLKGAVLTPLIYKDFGLRWLNDFDFLISLNDRQAVSNCLKNNGYSIGMYNWSTSSVDSISREEELLWKMHVGNLYPHTKAIDDGYCDFVSIDLSYDVDLQKNYTASSLLLENVSSGELCGQESFVLDKTDFLIHLCIHLYKEATNVQWVLYHSDLNLIKFCDVREYLLSIIDSLDTGYLCSRAQQLGAKEAVFYTFYYLDYLYQEQYSQRLLSEVQIEDTTYLEKYGELDYDAPQKWRKSFYKRFFSLSNMDELEDTSKLEKIKTTLS